MGLLGKVEHPSLLGRELLLLTHLAHELEAFCELTSALAAGVLPPLEGY